MRGVGEGTEINQELRGTGIGSEDANSL